MRKQLLRILLLCCALIALTAITVFATEEDDSAELNSVSIPGIMRPTLIPTPGSGQNITLRISVTPTPKPAPQNFTVVTHTPTPTATPTPAATIVDSGYCGGEGDGTNLSWTLNSEGTLTINGELYRHCTSAKPPTRPKPDKAVFFDKFPKTPCNPFHNLL